MMGIRHTSRASARWRSTTVEWSKAWPASGNRFVFSTSPAEHGRPGAHESLGTESSMSFDLQPILRSEILELRPLRPEDFYDLYAVASDPLIWEQHPVKDRYKEEVFKGILPRGLGIRGDIDRHRFQIGPGQCPPPPQQPA